MNVSASGMLAAFVKPVELFTNGELWGCGRKLGLAWRSSMYSYEDRIRAVELYVTFGKRAAATVLQLGNPTTGALKRWHEEYQQCHDLPAGYVRSKPKYSPEQKAIAVAHYLNHGRCLAFTRRSLGYPGKGQLPAWLDELSPEPRRRVTGKAGGVSHPSEIKQAAVIALCTRGESAQQVAQRVGVSRPTLYNWKNKIFGREVPASMKRHDESPQ